MRIAAFSAITINFRIDLTTPRNEDYTDSFSSKIVITKHGHQLVTKENVNNSELSTYVVRILTVMNLGIKLGIHGDTLLGPSQINKEVFNNSGLVNSDNHPHISRHYLWATIHVFLIKILIYLTLTTQLQYLLYFITVTPWSLLLFLLYNKESLFIIVNSMIFKLSLILKICIYLKASFKHLSHFERELGQFFANIILYFS